MLLTGDWWQQHISKSNSGRTGDGGQLQTRGISNVVLGDVWWKEQTDGKKLQGKRKRRGHNIQMADWDLVS